MHILFFNTNLIDNFYPDHNGKKYLFLDTDGLNKLQGPAILEQIRSHFNCPTATGGI